MYYETEEHVAYKGSNSSFHPAPTHTRIQDEE
jgi:hypothetical protein